MSLRHRTLPAAALLCTAALMTGCGTTLADSARQTDDKAAAPAGEGRDTDRMAPLFARDRTARADAIPGLGPRTRAQIPDGTRQALVVTGEGRDEDASSVALYVRDTERGWQRTAGPWHAHNALRGWTDDHRQGDLRSPIGVYGLTDAGGLLPDPGTRLPYDRGPLFSISGRGFEGEPLEGSFDHVVAINYNREPGTSPLDGARPLGEEKGGGIWIHVDHGGPTQGCVSLSLDHMKQLLRALNPQLRPVVVMGDTGSLAR